MCEFGGVYLVKFTHLRAPYIILVSFLGLEIFENVFVMTMYEFKWSIYLRAPYLIYAWLSVSLTVRHSLSMVGLVRVDL